MAYQPPQQPNRRSYPDQRPPRPPYQGDRDRSYNGGGQRPYNQGPRPPRQQGGWNGEQRPYNNRRPGGPPPRGGRPPHKLPGKGNPKQNYLKIKPGTNFKLELNRPQVKLFATDSYEELEFAVNKWMAEEKYSEIIDIKYSSAAYYGCSCCIIYMPEIEGSKTVVFKPDRVPQTQPAEGGAVDQGQIPKIDEPHPAE